MHVYSLLYNHQLNLLFKPINECFQIVVERADHQRAAYDAIKEQRANL
jgi:hypothetical protein